MQLFDDILLSTVTIESGTMPVVEILGHTIPPYFYASDFFLLEKYAIPKSDQVLLANLASAIQYQSVLFYMSENVYMSSFIFMGGYDLGSEPEWIDIKRYFEEGLASIIDNAADLENFIYVYRIVSQHKGFEHASHYVAGIQSLTYERNEAYVFDDTDIEPTRGAGSLYRLDSAGTMIIKGFPAAAVNPRFKGPIEHDKESARRQAFSQSCLYLETKTTALESAALAGFETLDEVTDTIREELL